MVGKTPRASKSERDRMDTIVHFCGCLPCLLVGYLDVHTSIEHVTERGRRIGKDAEQHRWTIGMCVWHHFGYVHNHSSRHKMCGKFGPPLTWGRKSFEEHFGDEVTVLVPVQDFMLELFAADPWLEYAVTRHAAHEVRDHWINLNHAAHQHVQK